MQALLRLFIFIIGSVFIIPMAAFAGQFDAPYYDLLEKNKRKWKAEDKKIDQRLAALEKKFGKSTTSDKPAIYFPAESEKLKQVATFKYIKSDRKLN